MVETGLRNTSGTYLAARICCIFVKGGATTIVTNGIRGGLVSGGSSTIGGFNWKGRDYSNGKEVL